MRYAVLFVLLFTAPASAQSVPFDKLDLASDLRFTATHCFALKTDWDVFRRYLGSEGVPFDVFNPNAMEAGYISAADRSHEQDLQALGANAYCKRKYTRYYNTGMFRQLSPTELGELNRLRRLNGGDEIKPFE
ncbi:hypothetical protein [Methylobacterium gnaphalii]|uniref:YARHG domain-containing protein n=1 Tax=Methylobacterium gnaphalii TaxID=1010610 RepID=A0A512JIM7_9HYPH|nr:hypothetical protein [Methylobacterium gnaphalii]GEP09807.1 hypothetical protein MGN01_16520 [Methylobacterium gnaphalii]GJD67278.1 hypothetical protein MMMDOFMJ_0192 [Methylobacterium gnaphalii]GLS49837.1 hypothetical protein GCM10007885_26890 [Methylobacterium gnaphalii]